MIIHIDCNNFFVSCERIFRPDLETKPVVVLSNTNGCTIARSDEAKALGIKMCQPFFEIKHFEKTHNLIAFSANFSLYTEISNRMARIVGLDIPTFEKYSIDECFLEMTPQAALPVARIIKTTLFKELSLPVSIGIGRTKTEAKLATYFAKKTLDFHGICHLPLLSEQEKMNLCSKIPPSALWGINIKSEELLTKQGICTAAQFLTTSHTVLKNLGGVAFERISLELQGISCFSIQTNSFEQKQLTHSRRFASTLTQFSDVKDAVFSFACQAAKRLRANKQTAQMVTLTLVEQGPYEASPQETMSIALSSSTNCSIQIGQAATVCLKRIFKKRTLYKKASILLSHLESEQNRSVGLFETEASIKKETALMQTLDTLHARYGKKSLFLGGEGFKEPWAHTSLRRSPRYTTCWDELPIAFAK